MPVPVGSVDDVEAVDGFAGGDAEGGEVVFEAEGAGGGGAVGADEAVDVFVGGSEDGVGAHGGEQQVGVGGEADGLDVVVGGGEPDVGAVEVEAGPGAGGGGAGGGGGEQVDVFVTPLASPVPRIGPVVEMARVPSAYS